MDAFNQQRNEILVLPVAAAHARVQQLIEQQYMQNEPNWWLGVAQVAASDSYRYREQGEQELAFEWATVALTVYHHLATTLNPVGRDSYEASAMMLRAGLIKAYGENPDHPLLQLALLKDWFFTRLPLPYEDAARLAAIPLDEQRIGYLRRLRQIKNRLRVFAYLATLPAIAKDAELRRWLDLRPRLP